MASSATENSWGKLRSAIAGRRVIPRIPTGRRVALAPGDDESSALEEGRAATEAVGLFITYVDAAGSESERRITVRALVGVPPTLVQAFCHERGACRSFRLDRIREAICTETGEVLAGGAILDVIQGAGFSGMDRVLRRAVNVLVFLMRCDGHAHPAEWIAVDDALSRFGVRFDASEGQIEMAMSLARKIAPDADDFLIGMRSFASSQDAPQIGRWLGRSVADVIDADGWHAPEEISWLVEVQDFLRHMSDRSGCLGRGLG